MFGLFSVIFAVKFYWTMEQLSIFDVICVAYRSRFLFRTDAEYREVWGASFETVAGKRDSSRDMGVYYSILNREVAQSIDRQLDDLIEDYVIASEVYLALDWGDRNQMASRKKFCRMLFRLAATAGKPLATDELLRFKSREADEELLRVFCPEGPANAPMAIICFVVLFAFDIVRPWSGDKSRARDVRNEETLGLLRRLRELIQLLRSDMPRLGSTEKPLVFNEWCEIIDNYLNDSERLVECAPLMMLTSLLDVARGCRSLVDSEQQRIEGESFFGLYMNGIWVDDADSGENRFWIFPDNCLGAMCFSRNGVGWEMGFYDFRVKESISPAYYDSFILLTPRGNLNYTLTPQRFMSDEQMVAGSYERVVDETSGELVRVNLFDDPLRFPQWLNWRSWLRLSADDPLYREFRTVLAEIYDPQSPHSVIFRNIAPELTDCVNNLVGRDNKYLYVFDWQPKRFLIREKSPEVFAYEGDCKHYATRQALFELPISEANPLYAIPINMKRPPRSDAELEKLANVMTDADNIAEAYVMHSAGLQHPRLVLPTYGATISLDPETLAALGIVKICGGLGIYA